MLCTFPIKSTKCKAWRTLPIGTHSLVPGVKHAPRIFLGSADPLDLTGILGFRVGPLKGTQCIEGNRSVVVRKSPLKEGSRSCLCQTSEHKLLVLSECSGGREGLSKKSTTRFVLDFG